MSLTQTGGSGSLNSVLGVYTSTGDVTATGTGTNNVILVAGTLTIAGGSSVTFGTLTASALSAIDVTDNSHLTVSGLAGVGALNNYSIGTGGALTLASGVTLTAAQTINFTDATGALEVGTAGLAVNLLDTINGFQPGNAIILDGATYTPVGSSYNPATGTLTLVGTGGTPNATIPVGLAAGLPAPEYFHLSVVGGNEQITLNATAAGGIAACYLRGSRIATAGGEVAIEHLRIGDRVITASGACKPIRWIGVRAYSGRFLTSNPDALPILIKQGALGRNMPTRDLSVSPRHAMLLNGLLVPAWCLVNGVSIVRRQSMEEVEYHHIELDEHDVVLAEGAPSESYVDDNNRGMFHNAATFQALYPDAAKPDVRYCAPRLEAGYEVEAIRAELLALTEEASEQAMVA